MPLPLSVSCFSESRLVLPLWYWLTWIVPEKTAVKLVCVCVIRKSVNQWACEVQRVIMVCLCRVSLSSWATAQSLCSWSSTRRRLTLSWCGCKPPSYSSSSFESSMFHESRGVLYWTRVLGCYCLCRIMNKWHCCTFSALTLLNGCQEEHPACKKWMMRCWCGYLSGVRWTLFAYGPADTTASQNPIISCII